MTKTTVVADLLEPFQILTHLGVEPVGEDLVILAVDNVLLPVQEPFRNLELSWVLHDGDDSLEFIRVELTGTISDHGDCEPLQRYVVPTRDPPLVKVDICFAANCARITTAHTLDFSQGEPVTTL